jgi:hypothetical protein
MKVQHTCPRICLGFEEAWAWGERVLEEPSVFLLIVSVRRYQRKRNISRQHNFYTLRKRGGLERIANTRRLEFQIFFLILDGEDFLVKLIVDRIVAKPRGRKGNKVSYSQELSGSRFTVLSFFVALGPSRSLPQQIVKSETIEKVFIEPGALGRRIFSFDNKV